MSSKKEGRSPKKAHSLPQLQKIYAHLLRTLPQMLFNYKYQLKL